MASSVLPPLANRDRLKNKVKAGEFQPHRAVPHLETQPCAELHFARIERRRYLSIRPRGEDIADGGEVGMVENIEELRSDSQLLRLLAPQIGRAHV